MEYEYFGLRVSQMWVANATTKAYQVPSEVYTYADTYEDSFSYYHFPDEETTV
jgi:hypothetical protein